MEAYESFKTETATYVWSGNWPTTEKMHPKFYERIDGRTIRVSTKRGFELVQSGVFEMTPRLEIYFNTKKMKEKKEKVSKIQNIEFFKDNLWKELTRYTPKGVKQHPTVTCTEDNIENLFNSQFEDKTIYGQVYLYKK